MVSLFPLLLIGWGVVFTILEKYWQSTHTGHLHSLIGATTNLLMKIWWPGGLWCAVVASLGLCRPPGYSINPDQLLSGYQEQRIRSRSLTSPVFSPQSSVLSSSDWSHIKTHITPSLPPCDGASSAHGSSRCSVWNSSLHYRKKGFTSSVSNGTIGSECIKYRAANDLSVFTITIPC